MYMPYPFQIIQSTEVHHDGLSVRRRGPHHLHGRSQGSARPTAGWAGRTATGKAKRSSSTRPGFNDLSWFDRAGNFHSDALHVVERITRARVRTTLNYEATIEDPKVFTRPWKMSMPLYRRVEKGAQLLEFRCVEFVEDLIYGHLRKPAVASSAGRLQMQPSIACLNERPEPIWRSSRSVGVLVPIAVSALAAARSQADTGQAAATREGSRRRKTMDTPPRTPDGQPDLQGFWTNSTYTPLERPTR